MLLKVTKETANGFIPSLKVDGIYWQAPRALTKGEALEVHDFIGHSLMSTYKGAFEIIQNDPIKDGVDNTITIEDVDPSLAKKAKKPISRKAGVEGISKKIMGDSTTARQVAAFTTAAEYSDVAAARIDADLSKATGVGPVDMDAVKAEKPISSGDAGLEEKAKEVVKAAQQAVAKPAAQPSQEQEKK